MGFVRKSRPSESMQDDLTQRFVAGTVVSLCGANHKMATYFHHGSREMIAYVFTHYCNGVSPITIGKEGLRERYFTPPPRQRTLSEQR